MAEIYRLAVRTLGPSCYNAEQVQAWSAWVDDGPAFQERFLQGQTRVVEVGARVIAFAHLHPIDHLDLLYCHPDHMRRGHAARLCRELELLARTAGVTHLDTNASRIARPFFEREGWELLKIEKSVHRGVEFERFHMGKELAPF